MPNMLALLVKNTVSDYNSYRNYHFNLYVTGAKYLVTEMSACNRCQSRSRVILTFLTRNSFRQTAQVIIRTLFYNIFCRKCMQKEFNKQT